MPARECQNRIRFLQLIVAVTLAFLAPSALSLPASAQTTAGKVPLAHETMWLMKRVGAPVPSPDGKWVVFSLASCYDEKDRYDLWIVPDGTPARERVA